MEDGQRIQLEGVWNTRDLGGYQTQDNRQIKYKKLIRSGTLANLTEQDKKVLIEQCQLKVDIDFRTEKEAAQKPDPVMEGVLYIHNPILSESSMGVTKESAGGLEELILMATEFLTKLGGKVDSYMESTYNVLVESEYSVSQYKKFFQILLEQEEGAVLWHCSAGKDRVGVGTALLLSALGVPRDVIVRDYMLTNQYLKPETDAMVSQIARINSDPVVLDATRILNGVSENYLEAAILSIDTRYGNVGRFLDEVMELTPDKIQILKMKYTEPIGVK